MIKATTKKLTAAFIDTAKLSFAGRHFAKILNSTAKTVGKHDSNINALADLIKQDKVAAVQFITATLDRMDKDGVKGEPRRIVKVSLARAIKVLHDNAVKIRIAERPERTISIEDVPPVTNWLENNQAMLKKLGLVMAENDLLFYDIAAAVATVSEVVAVDTTDKDIKAARLANEAENVRTYEKGVMAEVLAANG